MLDFRRDIATFGNRPAPLKVTPRGHIYVPTKPSTQIKTQNKSILTLDQVISEQTMYPTSLAELNAAKLQKLHVHLGHAPPNTMMRILMQSKSDVRLEEVKKMVISCGCDQTKFGYQRPLIHSNRPLKCGSHVSLDIFFPVPSTGMRLPFLLMICMLSRFALTSPLASHRPEHIIEAFFATWCQSMGNPSSLITDHGKPFQGAEWNQFSNAFAIEHVMHSIRTPHENGIAERAIALIKTGYATMKSVCPLLSPERLVTWSRMVKNLTPMLGSGLSPSEVMLGRNNVLESLGRIERIETSTDGQIAHTMQAQLQASLKARSAVILEDARRIVRIGTSRNIRSGAKQDFKINDKVQIYMKDDDLEIDRWIPGYRVIGLTSHHVVVERGDKIIKHPQFKTRLHGEEMENTQGQSVTAVQEESGSMGSSQARRSDNINCIRADYNKETGEHGSINTAQCKLKAQMLDVDYQYMCDASRECASGKWIKAASQVNDNNFDENVANGVENEEIDEDMERSALSGADMNRITPKYFPKCPRALKAIQKELAGLLRVHNGQAALELTTNQDGRWQTNRRIHSMIVTKRKSTMEFKARLVLRGDTISEQDTAFASAPTACRGSISMLLTWAVIFRLSAYMVDISQAFLQADEM